MCKVWPVNLPESLHFSTKFLSTVIKLCWSSPNPGFPGILSGTTTDYRQRKYNSKISCMESVMSCGARDNIHEVSTSFITHTNFKRTVICSHSRVKLQITVKIAALPLFPSPQNLLIWLSCGLASALFLLHILLQLFGVVGNLENDSEASNLGSWDGWLWWTKEMLRDYLEVGVWVLHKNIT